MNNLEYPIAPVDIVFYNPSYAICKNILIPLTDDMCHAVSETVLNKIYENIEFKINQKMMNVSNPLQFSLDPHPLI